MFQGPAIPFGGWHILTVQSGVGPQAVRLFLDGKPQATRDRVEATKDLPTEDVPIETSSEAQFERLRGIDHRSVPRIETTIPMQHREYAIHHVAAEVGGATQTNVHLTNKRLIVEGAKKTEYPVPTIDEIEVDADTSTILLRITNLKTPVTLRVDEPVYFASLISLATTLDERPKSFT